MVIFNSYVKLPEGIAILQGNIRILIGNYSHFFVEHDRKFKGNYFDFRGKYPDELIMKYYEIGTYTT